MMSYNILIYDYPFDGANDLYVNNVRSEFGKESRIFIMLAGDSIVSAICQTMTDFAVTNAKQITDEWARIRGECYQPVIPIHLRELSNNELDPFRKVAKQNREREMAQVATIEDVKRWQKMEARLNEMITAAMEVNPRGKFAKLLNSEILNNLEYVKNGNQ